MAAGSGMEGERGGGEGVVEGRDAGGVEGRDAGGGRNRGEADDSCAPISSIH